MMIQAAKTSHRDLNSENKVRDDPGDDGHKINAFVTKQNKKKKKNSLEAHSCDARTISIGE
jgi:hypothetical protein